jgi:hypothetical protein
MLNNLFVGFQNSPFEAGKDLSFPNLHIVVKIITIFNFSFRSVGYLMVLLDLQLLQPMIKVCYFCQVNICAPPNIFVAIITCRVFFYLQGMMYILETFVVWFQGNMSTKTFHRDSKFITSNLKEFFRTNGM